MNRPIEAFLSKKSTPFPLIWPCLIWALGSHTIPNGIMVQASEYLYSYYTPAYTTTCHEPGTRVLIVFVRKSGVSYRHSLQLKEKRCQIIPDSQQLGTGIIWKSSPDRDWNTVFNNSVELFVHQSVLQWRACFRSFCNTTKGWLLQCLGQISMRVVIGFCYHCSTIKKLRDLNIVAKTQFWIMSRACQW